MTGQRLINFTNITLIYYEHLIWFAENYTNRQVIIQILVYFTLYYCGDILYTQMCEKIFRPYLNIY